MVSTTGIRMVGNNLIAFRDNGTSKLFLPTPGGLFIPSTGGGVDQGAGGEGPAPQKPQPSPTPPAVPPSDSGSVDAVDDYPWPHEPQNDLSPLRYSYRDCTDFAAWRINRDNGCTSSPWMYTWGQLRITNGDAIGWKHDWDLHGWPTSTTPKVGWIGWFGSKAGAYGHVNYVQAVRADGSIHMEEYNWGAAHHQAYNERDASPGSAYFPDAFLSLPPKR